MYRIIGGDQKEYGPAEAADLIQWISEGRLSGQSLAQRDGEKEWRPVSEFPEFSEALREQALRFASAQPPTSDEGAVSSLEPSAPYEPSRFSVGHCFARAWGLLSANFGLLFGASFVVWMVSMVLQFLPLVGAIYWIVRGVLYGGLFLVFLNCIRGQDTSVGEVFGGFGSSFSQLLLVGIVTAFLSWIGFLLCVFPWVYLTVLWIFAIPLVADRRMDFWRAMELSRKTVAPLWGRVFVLVLLAFLPVILAQVMTEFKVTGLMLAASRETFGSAEPSFGQLLQELPKLMTQVAQSASPYILVTKVVWLLNLPVAVGTLMYAYEDLFGRGSSKRP